MKIILPTLVVSMSLLAAPASAQGFIEDNSSMIFWIVILLIVGFVGLIVVAEKISESTGRNLMMMGVADIEDFSPAHQFLGVNGRTSISVDSERRKVCLTSLSDKTPRHRIISYKDLLSVELIQDGHSISKTSRTSQVGNALLGGVLLGGVGAVIGALTSASTTKGLVTNLKLEIVVNDENSPVFSVNFQNINSKENGPTHEGSLKKAREWMGRLNVLIKLADEEDEEDNIPTDEQTSTLSVADELKKLADLMQQGLLTEDEFSQQKKMLLGNSDNVPNPDR